MKFSKLGTTDLQIPPIVFGGNVFGWTLNEKESFAMLDRLYDLGFRTIDTADSYSHWVQGNKGGESENIIGKWMKQKGVRHDIHIFTKVGSNPGQDGRDVSREYILKAAEHSLQRLETDHIDLYFTHWDDEKTPVEETLSAYQRLMEQGKVRYIGASNLSENRLLASLDAAEKENLPKYSVSQPEYSLMQRSKFEGRLADICEKHKLGVVPYFSLASGFLTGKYTSEEDMKGSEREKFLKPYFNDRGFAVLRALDEIANNHNTTPAAIALRWIIQRPGISAPIASATKKEHLKAFTDACDLELDKAEMERLNEASS